nr:leucine-rich repeat-containing protein 47-like [Onthophagus taurus]
MVWEEVQIALSEKRRELVLTGSGITERIKKSGLDTNIFNVTTLNYLNISETILENLPDDVGNLINLQTLVLHTNKLSKINENVFKLDKLKMLDLSNNVILEISEAISNLTHLTTLNLSMNKLENLPDLAKNVKLSSLDVSNNKLKCFKSVCCKELGLLSELKLHGNQIEVIPNKINGLISLKNLDLSLNKIKIVPGEIIDCNKIKEIQLKSNPISDRRLQKLIDQCRTKQILDYVKQHSERTLEVNVEEKNVEEVIEEDDNRKKYKIVIKHFNDGIKIVSEEKVKNVRGYILCCIVHNVEFTPESFKKFIQLQNKLHQEICDQRNNATIATHDLTLINQQITNNTLIYSSCPSKDLKIIPLNRKSLMTGKELFEKLQAEAETLRKEKKRNNYSGIHKYLYLLKGKPEYPFLKVNETIISFPPITNSETTKISVKTTAIFLEVTSNKSLQMCCDVLDDCIKEFVQFFELNSLTIEQVKIVDVEGNLKSVYPSRTDLKFSESFIEVVRD